MMNSKVYYNKISKTYKAQSTKRLAYLNAIDYHVIETMKNKSISSYLDVGSGDGRRALKIASELKVSDLTLLDDSDGMLDLLEDKEVNIQKTSFFDFNSDTTYDLITCLWNVLGHFPTKAHRLEFFKIADKLLNDNGLLIFDVNNRFNIAYYGFENVMNNLIDERSNKDNVGWFTIGNNTVETKVYIHSPFDINEYLKDTSLKLFNTLFVNYETGDVEKTFFEGQLFYVIRKKDE